MGKLECIWWSNWNCGFYEICAIKMPPTLDEWSHFKRIRSLPKNLSQASRIAYKSRKFMWPKRTCSSYISWVELSRVKILFGQLITRFLGSSILASLIHISRVWRPRRRFLPSQNKNPEKMNQRTLSKRRNERKTDYSFVWRVHRMRSPNVVYPKEFQNETILTIKNLYSNREKWEFCCLFCCSVNFLCDL